MIGTLSPEITRPLIDWNQTAQPYPNDKTVHQLFEDQVERTPHSVALVFGERSLTYQAVNERANQLAHHLQRLGVGPDDLIALSLTRSCEMIIAILAILKAGGAYVPLDANYPVERLQFILDDTQAAIVLTEEHLLPQFNQFKGTILPINTLELTTYPTTNPFSQTRAHHLAYVIYTSGSTGTPKGVMVEHQKLCNLVLRTPKSYGWRGGEERVLHYHSLSFDTSIFEIFAPLVIGAEVVLAPPMLKLDLQQLIGVINHYQITAMAFTPSVLRLFLDLISKEQLQNCKKHLKAISLGGEALDNNLTKNCLETFPGSLIYNGYGPTEATVDACAWKCQLPFPEGAHRVPIGRPLANTQVYVLDELQQPVPIGVQGELYLGGAGIARVYLNRPELTAQKFIPNPFASEQDKIQGRNLRLYQTGDRVRYLQDGNLEYLGRYDEQVKIRGFRIECGEIANQLQQQPEIKEAVVIVREDEPGNKRLVAYIIPKSPKPNESELPEEINRLRLILSQTIPEYTIPSHFIWLEHFPITINSKLYKKALPRPENTAYKSIEQYLAPRNELEKQLALCWQTVLNLPRVGISDNFFDLGGHSLLAVRLIYQINQQLNASLSVIDCFKYPTIEGLATFLSGQVVDKFNLPLLLIQSEGKQTPLFLIHSGGGLALPYLALKPFFGEKQQPLYGLNNPYFGRPANYTSITDMPTHYISYLKQIQPNGPYQLGGWSFGGMIALEMARQLEQHNEAVKLVVLIDSYNLEAQCS